MDKNFFVILILVGILIVYLLGNYYIFSEFRKSLALRSKWGRISCGITYWILVSLFPLHFSSYSVSFNPTIAHILHEVGTGWLVFTAYMIALLLIFEIIKRIYKPIKRSFIYALSITLILLSFGFYNYQNPSITEVNISIDKAIGSDEKTFRVVGISDVHLSNGTNKAMLQKYVSEINKLNADMIIISGDLIDHSIQPLYEQNMQEELNQLQAKQGIYVCLGNHEYMDVNSSIAFLRTTKIEILRDSCVTLDNGIQVIGRDDYYNNNRKSIAELTSSLDKEFPILMLDHQPRELSEAAAAGVDLQFNGHTHNGQIWPFHLVTKMLFERSYGYEQRGDSHIYVSSGLSLWGPPFRIGTKSEIVIFNITFL